MFLQIQELSTIVLVNCYINFHLLKNDKFYDLQICNESSFNTTQEELTKRIIKPLYYFTIAICVCFLLLFSKENQNTNYTEQTFFYLVL